MIHIQAVADSDYKALAELKPLAGEWFINVEHNAVVYVARANVMGVDNFQGLNTVLMFTAGRSLPFTTSWGLVGGRYRRVAASEKVDVTIKITEGGGE